MTVGRFGGTGNVFRSTSAILARGDNFRGSESRLVLNYFLKHYDKCRYLRIGSLILSIDLYATYLVCRGANAKLRRRNPIVLVSLHEISETCWFKHIYLNYYHTYMVTNIHI